MAAENGLTTRRTEANADDAHDPFPLRHQGDEMDVNTPLCDLGMTNVESAPRLSIRDNQPCRVS